MSTGTATRGFPKIASTQPEFETNGHHADFNTFLDQVDAIHGVANASADGAIAVKEGTVFVTKASAAALTLAAPTAGLPSAGGDDGKNLKVVSTTAFAHTITTPSNKLNGASHIATFGGAVGDEATLQAFNGVWYLLPSTHITLS